MRKNAHIFGNASGKNTIRAWPVVHHDTGMNGKENLWAALYGQRDAAVVQTLLLGYV